MKVSRMWEGLGDAWASRALGSTAYPDRGMKGHVKRIALTNEDRELVGCWCEVVSA